MKIGRNEVVEEFKSREDTLVLENIYKKYGDIEALNDLNLVLKKGECLVILGPSGAGKTTILKVIAGLEPVLSGKVYFRNRLINNTEPKDKNFAMVFETYALYPHLSVFDNLASPLYATKMNPSQIKEEVHGIAKVLGIFPFLDRKPGFLSGGQRQRVALGRALVKPADLFLMDEPIAHLDAKLRHQMIGEFKRLQEKRKNTTIYVTHNWHEAMSLGNHILILNNGRVEQYGTKEEIFLRPKNTFVAQIIGDPTMNLMKGEIIKEASESIFKANGVTIPLHENMPLGEVYLGTRASKLKLAKTTKDSFEAEVYAYGRHGMKTVVSMKIGDVIFKTEFKGKVQFKIGEKILIQLDLKGACVFDENKELIKIIRES